MIAAFRSVSGRLSKSLLLSLAAVPVLQGAAIAQSPQVRDPSSVLISPPPVPRATPPDAPVVHQDIEVPSVEPALDVIFDRVHVIGATAIPERVISAPFTPLFGRRATLAELRAALDQVNRLYATSGFALSRAFIPAQAVQDGALTVRVVEGYIGEIRIEAETEARRQLVLRFGDDVLTERPLRTSTLQRYLLTLRDVPGLTAGSKIVSFDVNSGAAVLAISADLRPFSASTSIDHRAKTEGLPFQLFVGATLNNPLGSGDQFSLITLATDDPSENNFLQGSYTAMIGDSGARVLASASTARLHADEAVPGFTLVSSSRRYAANFSYPLIRSVQESLNAVVGTYYASSDHEYSGVRLLEDELLAAVVEAQYSRRLGEDWATNVVLRLTQGLDLFGIGETQLPHTRAGTTTDFTKLRATASLSFRATERLSFILTSDAQYSPVSLLSAEEITFGGSRFGRGYDQAEIGGDRGYAVSLQSQYRVPISESKLWSLMPYVFADYAQAFNTPSSGPESADLFSTGLGTWISRGQSVSVGLEADKPLTRIPRLEGDKDWRYYFMLQYHF
jgi:hemolysin activation/secretion protein